MLTEKQVKNVKMQYPKGTPIELGEMHGESRMTPGLKGVVKMVDDIGQIHVSWENGSGLALNIEEDSFHVIEQREGQESSRKSKQEQFFEEISKVVENVDLMELAISTNGPDRSMAQNTLAQMQNTFEKVYGTEPLKYSNGTVSMPAVIEGKNTGVKCLGIVTVDLKSSGELWDTTFFTPTGAVRQQEMGSKPRIKEYLEEHFIPYNYWYTPEVENDFHVNFSEMPEEIREMGQGLFEHSGQSQGMQME